MCFIAKTTCVFILFRFEEFKMHYNKLLTSYCSNRNIRGDIGQYHGCCCSSSSRCLSNLNHGIDRADNGSFSQTNLNFLCQCCEIVKMQTHLIFLKTYTAPQVLSEHMKSTGIYGFSLVLPDVCDMHLFMLIVYLVLGRLDVLVGHASYIWRQFSVLPVTAVNCRICSNQYFVLCYNYHQ